MIVGNGSSSAPATANTNSLLTEYPDYEYSGLSGIEAKM